MLHSVLRIILIVRCIALVQLNDCKSFQISSHVSWADEDCAFKIDEKPILATSLVKLLNITVQHYSGNYSSLRFSEHINALCTKANNETSKFLWVAECLYQGQETHSFQCIYHDVKFQLLPFNLDVLWERCLCSNKSVAKGG